MKIAVLKETRPGETRVAASPETVRKFLALGAAVAVERGAGERASFSDEQYQEAGAEIAGSAAEAAKGADLVLKVQRPTEDEIAMLERGARLVAIMAPHGAPEIVKACAAAGVEAFAMDLMPRITRAQSMDVLSSQSNLAGYKAVIDAAAYYGRAFPLMMTAAGMIAPAKVFVMGAGVAGLQAIATARRLGAVVSATDVRYAAKEQVESLGATFITVDEEAMKSAETEAGYAREMSEDFKRRQAELVAEHIRKQNVVITTALIPGRPAPKLVTEAMVRSMAPGSVIVDLAVEAGGNVELSQPGEAVDVGGVIILGFTNVPGRLPADASSLYARNVYNFVAAFWDKEEKRFAVDWEDEIVKGVALTRDGRTIHPQFGGAESAVSDEGDVAAGAPAESGGGEADAGGR
ncbi:Re/Si-specific NAD(P)(+) transhydrogenase subunit alpha [Amphiplicatus metriothermophilus]|uniref:NAD(P) transhydrogenase subunit alpha part 1 n=1 Tax=Amphiplicatus metriothermophilus TaxID=1519374 RepID=A0A239PPG5_9PROT|nr:Re/Si-specific NAD(P)(+) transhydrogenase subunit alpha [Amphiplicatus metriothermophilus]MBB5518643.1 NAD(P) transhydrogenase subunit alpha [Amphiplicatus metriothermophilus]SNT72199.1 NAD(P) transhydrogenase subunit alpha [Amphiplicatus metriothermophilus]